MYLNWRCAASLVFTEPRRAAADIGSWLPAPHMDIFLHVVLHWNKTLVRASLLSCVKYWSALNVTYFWTDSLDYPVIEIEPIIF